MAEKPGFEPGTFRPKTNAQGQRTNALPLNLRSSILVDDYSKVKAENYNDTNGASPPLAAARSAVVSVTRKGPLFLFIYFFSPKPHRDHGHRSQ